MVIILAWQMSLYTTIPMSLFIISEGENNDELIHTLEYRGINLPDTVTYCRWRTLLYQQWQTPPPANKAIQIPGAKCEGSRQVASIQLWKTECGSSAQSCQANVIQTVNGAEVAVGKTEIPHCITTLLSKLYYLGHCLVYGCQSYHTETETALIGLCLHPHINTHIEKAKCCEYN